MGYLIDRYKRDHTYLRISVTERCNLRCRYCLPADTYGKPGKMSGIPFKHKGELLTYDEIVQLSEIFLSLGVKKIRITGGEPLVRKDIEVLCGEISKLSGLETLALSTNGTMLEEKALLLKEAGVESLNISLDTLKEERFKNMTFVNGHDSVLRGIEAAIKAGFESIKINTVIIRGYNDDELIDFAEFANVLSINVRFIEYMPFPGNGWRREELVPFDEMRREIESEYELLPIDNKESVHGPAKEFRIGSNANTMRGRIGFITTMSDHFCSSCNRIRLTADGKLRNCLFARDGADLKRLLRSGASRDVIEDSIKSAIILKWKEHPDHDELEKSRDNRSMTAIGG